MKMIMAKLERFRRIRQLHTIISQEIIKPSSPTSSHLKTHNLSLLDLFNPNVHMPAVFFYKHYNYGDIEILKKSLSHSLTRYYPFAGKLLAPSAPHIECNDEGVEFLEAFNDSRVNDFVLKKEQDETLDQLFPYGLGCDVHKSSYDMIKIQVNHFACGGVAVAVSMSHKVADAFTMIEFINHWATVTRGGLPINPSFISSSINNNKIQEFTFSSTNKVDYVTRRFVFPNSKLNELKSKVNVLDSNQLNPTRVEMLTSLLFKCSVDAATTNSGYLHPSNLNQRVNMRKKIINCPEIAAGNICTSLIVKMGDSEIKLNEVIAKLRKKRMGIKQIRDIKEVWEMLVNTLSELEDDETRTYRFSSLCRFPFYKVDFGWGKPVRVIIPAANASQNLTVLMDTPDGDGIEATMRMKKEEMAIFEKDKELIAYIEDN